MLADQEVKAKHDEVKNESDLKSNSSPKDDVKTPASDDKASTSKEDAGKDERTDETYPAMDNEKAEIIEFVPVSEKHYNRLGFYCVIEDPKNSKSKFDEYLKQLKQNADKKIKQTNELSKQNIDRFNFKISVTEKKLNEEKANLEKYRAELNKLKQKRENTITEFGNLKKKLHNAYKKLADEKRKLIDNRLKERLEEVKQELKKLIDNYLLLAEKKHEINKKNFEDNQNVFEKKVERFESWKKQLEESYKLIREKTDKLNRAGLTENIVNFLTYAGYFSLIAAGWFFSIFILERKLSSEDYLSFALMRIFTFGSDIFSTGNKYLVFLQLIVGLMGLLALIAGIIWVCQWLIDKRSGIGSGNELVVGLNEEENDIYLVGINSKSMLTTWLQIIPPVFIIGLIFILLSLFGTDESNVSTLLISLSGQFIGAVIALAATGIAMLYISNIIEPRLLRSIDRQNENLHSENWELFTNEKLRTNLFLQNFELVIIIVLFLIQFAAILLYQGIANVSIAISSFFVVTLFTAFCLGYGFKYRGLFTARRRMEIDIRNLSRAIEDNSRPQYFDLKSIEDKVFKKQFERCQSQFFDIISMRNHLAKELFFDKIRRPILLSKRVRDLFVRGNDKDLTLDARQLNSIEEKYFPELKQEIDDLKSEWERKKKEIGEIEAEIKDRNSRKTELDIQFLKRIQGLEASLFNYQKELIRQQELTCQKEDSIRKEYEKNETDMKDGYDLGQWYVRNRLFHSNHKGLPSQARGVLSHE
jgi:hypothetical protein